jgi:hypothetical protein
MKTPLLLIALMFCTTAFARIGETTEQLTKRYGHPVEKSHDNGESRLYSFRGFTILVGLDQGISQCEVYQKMDHSRMSEAEIRGLLDANVSNSAWRDDPEEGSNDYLYWSRDKKTRVAIYHLTTHTLLVTSKPFLARFSSLVHSNDRKRIEGF